jgi:hypothetical protein
MTRLFTLFLTCTVTVFVTCIFGVFVGQALGLRRALSPPS